MCVCVYLKYMMQSSLNFLVVTVHHVVYKLFITFTILKNFLGIKIFVYEKQKILPININKREKILCLYM